MSAAHTPGPWKATGNRVYRDFTSDGHDCAKFVASCDAADDYSPFLEQAANARLIAAAPETTALLAEIRLAYEAKDEWKLRDALAKVPVVLEKAGVPLAAIAKAEGKQ